MQTPPKPKIQKWVPWSPKVLEKRMNLKNYARLAESHPTHRNVETYNQARIQDKTDHIEIGSENKQSSIVWQAVNEITGRNRVYHAKIKATSQLNCLDKWQGHF